MTHSGRPLAVAALATVLATALLALLLPALPPTGAGFVPLLVSGCAAAGALATTWLWVLAVLVLLDVLRGRPARDGVPRVVRRAVLAACGLSLAGGLAAPAYADPGIAARGGNRPAEVLAGLPLPDRTTSTAQLPGSSGARLQASPRLPAGRDDLEEVRVSPGDTLWGLARRTLADDAAHRQVERRWRAIYAANRRVVGDDPDLIHPGQRLLLPGTASVVEGRG